MRLRQFVLMLPGALICASASAQIKTDETRKTVDPATGDTVVTQSVVITRSEDITVRNNVLLINPLKFFLLYNLSYMRRVSTDVVMGIGFQTPTLAGVDGWGVNAEVRFYPSGKAPRGFYIAPNFSYNSLRAGGVESTPTSVGILVGWQWFPGDDFAMGLGIGVDHYSGSTSAGGDNLGQFDGNVPALRFDIGYGW